MRYIIANWKMQLNEAESAALAQEIVRRWSAQATGNPGVKVVVCPSHLALSAVNDVVRGTNVALGAQDSFWEAKGAYTGEVSPVTLKQVGCEYCIVGHSERRQHLGETDEMVSRKVDALLAVGITPIICVGETREERDAGRRDSVVIGQVKKAMEGTRPVGTQHVIVAYEPRWVIGTGQAVPPDDAASMHQLIRETMLELLPQDVVERQVSIIYGGSVDAGNIAGFLAIPAVEGALVGGAALKADALVRLAEIATEA